MAAASHGIVKLMETVTRTFYSVPAGWQEAKFLRLAIFSPSGQLPPWIQGFAAMPPGARWSADRLSAYQEVRPGWNLVPATPGPAPLFRRFMAQQNKKNLTP
jgi:hypothetical protein